jgi:hypothetical protein
MPSKPYQSELSYQLQHNNITDLAGNITDLAGTGFDHVDETVSQVLLDAAETTRDVTAQAENLPTSVILRSYCWPSTGALSRPLARQFYATVVGRMDVAMTEAATVAYHPLIQARALGIDAVLGGVPAHAARLWVMGVKGALLDRCRGRWCRVCVADLALCVHSSISIGLHTAAR